MERTHCRTPLAVLLAVAVAACTSAGDEIASRDSERLGDSVARAAVRATTAMPEMSGTEGMRDTTTSGMSGDMRTHMMAMSGAAADSIQRLVPMHRQLVANMVAKMNGEMRDMQMTGDAAWSSTIDSLRQDLVRLPALSGPALTAMMPTHLARVTRLAAMHQQMMRAMAR